ITDSLTEHLVEVLSSFADILTTILITVFPPSNDKTKRDQSVDVLQGTCSLPRVQKHAADFDSLSCSSKNPHWSPATSVIDHLLSLLIGEPGRKVSRAEPNQRCFLSDQRHHDFPFPMSDGFSSGDIANLNVDGFSFEHPGFSSVLVSNESGFGRTIRHTHHRNPFFKCST